MRHWSYAEARLEFRRLIRLGQHVAESSWNVGVVSLRKLRDDPVEARQMFEKVVGLGGPHKEEALVSIVRTYMREEDYVRALESIARYEQAYPRGKYREDLAYYRGWLPYDHRDCKAAAPELWKVVKRTKSRRSLALGFYAWCFVRLKDWKQAEFAMSQLLAYDNPLVAGKGLYWGAYALDQQGKRDQALEKLGQLRERYPLTYYDVLGRQLEATWFGRDPTASALEWPKGGGDAAERHPFDPAAWTWPALDAPLAEELEGVRALVEVGEIDAARRRYAPIRGQVERRVPPDRMLDFVRFIGHQVEDYQRGWALVTGGKLNALSGMPDPADVRWLLAYPEAYRPLVQRLAADVGLPPGFIYSVMRQESRYNPAAVSNADAVGALQMIPHVLEHSGHLAFT
jgi:soluble lytic murein transglycosylase